MRGHMKLAGVARFDCVGSTQKFTCYMAGPASPAITPAAGRSARSKAMVSGDPASDGVSHLIAHDPQTARRSRSLFNRPPSRFQQAAVHHLRRGTPVTSRYTRSEGVQCLQSGCTASHNKPNRGQFLPTEHNRPPRTQPHGLDMLTPAPNERRCTS